MAREDYSPVPGVEARVSAPDDTQNIGVNPAAFGAPLAQGLEEAGAGVTQAAHFYGQVAADQQTNNYFDARDAILYGTPGKMVQGPGGQPMPDTGFLGLRGQDALNAYPQVKQQLDALSQKFGDSLQTPEAREMFENQTRRYRAQALEQAGNHADTQYRAWAQDTNNTTFTKALNDAARDPTNTALVDDALHRARSAAVRNAQLNYGDSEDIAQGAVLHADQQVALSRIRSLINSDPTSAQQVLDESHGILGSLSNYDSITRQVKGAVIDATMTPAIDHAVADAFTQAQGSVGMPGAGTSHDFTNVPFAQAKAQIMAGEGPARLGGYNAQVGNKPGGGNSYGLQPQNLTGMTMGQVYDYQRNTMLPATKGKRGPDDPGTSAVGAYQLVSGTLKSQAEALWGANWRDQLFNAANQDRIAQRIYDANHGNPAALAAQWPSLKGQQSYPSLTDSLTAYMPTALDKAQTDAERLFPNYPDAQERYVDGVRRRLEQNIALTHQQYEVDAHVVQSVLASDNPPITEQQLIAISPQVAQSWKNLQMNDPGRAIAIGNMLNANAKGRASAFGTDFKTYLDRVLAPASDPNRISDPTQLWSLTGPNNNSPLTNSGTSHLSTLMQGRGTPQGEADAQQIRKFVDDMHANLTFTNKAMGIYDAKGEARFGQFMAGVLPVIEKAKQQGNLSALLNPASKDYIGASAHTFMRNQSDIMKDRMEAQMGAQNLPAFTPQGLNQALDALDNDNQRQDALKAAVQQKRISIQDATNIGIRRGYISANTAQKEAANHAAVEDELDRQNAELQKQAHEMFRKH